MGGTKGFGSRGGLGARVGYEVMEVVLDMLARVLAQGGDRWLSGVSLDYVYKVDHILGGMYRPSDSDYDPRYLDREERYELARLIDAGHSIRETARRMRREASTISRELGRNRDPRTGRYCRRRLIGSPGSGSGGPRSPRSPATRG